MYKLIFSILHLAKKEV